MKHFKLFEKEDFSDPNYEPKTAKAAGAYLEWLDAHIDMKDNSKKLLKKWGTEIAKFCAKYDKHDEDLSIVDCAINAGKNATMKFIDDVATEFSFNFKD